MPLEPSRLNKLSIKEILHTVASNKFENFVVPAAYRTGKKELLVVYILEDASNSLLALLEDRIEGKTGGGPSASRKRKREDNQQPQCSRKAHRVEIQPNEGGEEAWGVGKFMEVVMDLDKRQCHQVFYNATSDSMVQPVVCGVCARENDLGEHPSSL
ncbi:hypothetical protein V5O48_013682 [Marasmius crinis-equi]|uniref:Uncharacterized protein n=1 Tax=Marasmius crinis-equi TaxID=585013 RepID=A0ABR3EZF3_9AGAR